MECFLYVNFWLFNIGALTVLVIVLYYQHGQRYRLRAVLAELDGYSDTILKFLEEFAVYLEHGRRNDALRVIGAGVLEKQKRQLQSLTDGRLEVDAVEMPKTFAILGDHYLKFDAISVCDLAFWTTRIADAFAKEYFRMNRYLTGQGKQVTRIFVVSRAEMRTPSVLAEILDQHQRAGIGFAVVVYDELPPQLRQYGECELDFALWDCDKAFSVFRQSRRGWTRNMQVVFALGSTNSEVSQKLVLYRRILLHAWMVDSIFKECHAEYIGSHADSLHTIKTQLENRTHTRLSPDAQFPVEVSADSTIEQKLKDLERLIEATNEDFEFGAADSSAEDIETTSETVR